MFANYFQPLLNLASDQSKEKCLCRVLARAVFLGILANSYCTTSFLQLLKVAEIILQSPRFLFAAFLPLCRVQSYVA